jgi:exodeoxyribonuclease-3
MKLATWNVNSIRARLDRVLAWAAAEQPDVLCLQETKVEDHAFPSEPFVAAGYHVSHAGQRTYNGVAILSKSEPHDVLRGLDDGEDDPQARLVAATVDGVRVISAYVPNGEAPESPKFAYKLRWLGRLRRYLDQRASPTQPLVLCGDFNVAPEERDVHDPEAWRTSTLFHDDARAALVGVTGFGLIDAYRLHDPAPGRYSWWDYRMLSFPKDRGLRIDHVFATRPLAERCRSAAIDREARKGKQPSDHAPVIVHFD